MKTQFCIIKDCRADGFGKRGICYMHYDQEKLRKGREKRKQLRLAKKKLVLE